MELGNNEIRMLKVMQSDPNRAWEMDDILSETGWQDQVHVAGAGKGLQDANMLEIDEITSKVVYLGPDGKKALQEGLLELKIWSWIVNQDEDDQSMKSLMSAGFERGEISTGIGILKGLGVTIDSGRLVIEDEKAISNSIEARSTFIQSLSEGPIASSELDEGMLEHFSTRGSLIEFEESVFRTWRLTKTGSAIEGANLEEVQYIGELTPEMLQTEA